MYRRYLTLIIFQEKVLDSNNIGLYYRKTKTNNFILHKKLRKYNCTMYMQYTYLSKCRKLTIKD